MEPREYFARAEVLNLPELRRKRPDWTDRLPHLHEPPTWTTRDLLRWHWSFLVPAGLRELYTEWIARRRYRLYLEQIERDELDEIVDATLEDDSEGVTAPIYEKHEQRREMLRFIVVCAAQRPRLERLARRWDVDLPRLVCRGEPDEKAMVAVRRGIRAARWLFAERCAKVLIPILSLLIALAAILR